MEQEKWSEGVQAFSAGIALDPERAGLWFNRAWCHLQMDQLTLAQNDLQALLHRYPAHAQGLGLWGRLQLAQGDLESAVSAMLLAYQLDHSDATLAGQALQALLLLPEREADAARFALQMAARSQLTASLASTLMGVLACAPDGVSLQHQLWLDLCQLPLPEAWMLDGWLTFCVEQQQTEEGVLACTRWLAIDPKAPRPLDQLCRLLAIKGDFAAALPVMLRQIQSLNERPETLDSWCLLVRSLFDAGDYRLEAGLLCNHALRLWPEVPELWLLRGQLYTRLAQSELALADYDHALSLQPDYRPALYERALAQAQTQGFEQALQSLDLALARAPVWPEGAEPDPYYINTRGTLLRGAGRLAESEATYRLGLQASPTPALAVNLAYVVLLQGRYAEGFELLNQRLQVGWSRRGFYEALQSGAQAWDGDPMAARGKRLLVLSQNGIGDTVQFARYLPWLQQQGVQVILQAPKRLGALLGSMHPGVQVFEEHDPLPPADLVTDVHSLPGQLGITLHDLDRCGGAHYLHVDDASRHSMALALGPARGLRVALAWKGTRSNLAERSVPLELIARLNLPGIEWFSLWFGPLEPEDEAPAQRLGLRHLDWPFSDVAAAMCCMDLVISVDTVHAHIAGALGLKTFILLNAVPDWRWHAQGVHSPWYPLATLFRQQHYPDWDAPLASLAEALRALLPAQAQQQTEAVAGGWHHIKQWWQGQAQQMGVDGMPLPAPVYQHGVRDALARAAPDQAHALCLQWMRQYPADPDAPQVWIDVLNQQGQALQMALPALLERARSHPQATVAALLKLSRLAYQQRREDATAIAHLAVQACPQSADAWLHLGEQHLQVHEPEAGFQAFERALALLPDDPRAITGRALAWCLMHRNEEALQLIDDLLQRHRKEPHRFDRVDALRARSVILFALERLQESELCLREAYGRHPTPAVAALLAERLLVQGQYAEGFSYLLASIGAHPHGPWTLCALRQGAQTWRGQVTLAQLRGQHLLITNESGFGDLFQFARFIPWMCAQGVQVTLLVRASTVALMSAALPGVTVAAMDPAQPAPSWVTTTQWVCDVEQLPALLKVDLADVAAMGHAHYLAALTPQPARHPLPALPSVRAHTPALRVGLAWRGQVGHFMPRSLPLALMAQHWANDPDLQHCQWYSLQGDPLREDEMLPAQQLQLQHAQWTFEDAASAIRQLDLVVSVDTSLCHLTGALGKPCWILLNHMPDWRWGLDGQQTPWYPQSRLFRQAEPGDWGVCLQRIKQELITLANKSGAIKTCLPPADRASISPIVSI